MIVVDGPAFSVHICTVGLPIQSVVHNGRPVPFVDVWGSAIASGGGGYGHIFKFQFKYETSVYSVLSNGQCVREADWSCNPAYPEVRDQQRLSLFVGR